MILPAHITDNTVSFPYLSPTVYQRVDRSTNETVNFLTEELEKYVTNKSEIPLSDEFNLGGVVYIPFSIWVKIQYHNARIRTKTPCKKLAERIECKPSQINRLNSFKRKQTDVDSLLSCLEFMGIVMTVDFVDTKED